MDDVTKEVTFYIYFSKDKVEILNKHADLIGCNNLGYFVYAIIDINVVKRIMNKCDMLPDDKTSRVGGWRYFNNVTWVDGYWKAVWKKHGPFKTASFE